jgi:hypothetical protein
VLAEIRACEERPGTRPILRPDVDELRRRDLARYSSTAARMAPLRADLSITPIRDHTGQTVNFVSVFPDVTREMPTSQQCQRASEWRRSARWREECA